MDRPGRAGPLLPGIIADGNEAHRPDEGPGISKKSKLREAEFRCPRYETGQVTNTRNEIPDQQAPTTSTVEPIMYPAHPLFRDVKPLAISTNEGDTEGMAKIIDDRNAADASEYGGGQGWDDMEMPLVDEVPRKGQQPLVGYRETDDPQHQKRKYPQVSVGIYKGSEMVHMLIIHQNHWIIVGQISPILFVKTGSGRERYFPSA